MVEPDPNFEKRPKLLVLELWGMGDLTFSTPLLRSAVEKYDVTLVGKPHARSLLEATFPEIRFVSYDAPWSAYRGKYRLWAWRWPELVGLMSRLRREKFDAAVSVRNDPRDHLLMWLVNAKRRFGFPRRGSQHFLSDPVAYSPNSTAWRIGAISAMRWAFPVFGKRSQCSTIRHTARSA
jgi:ADP-heptose:LPS heptosyltransferase